MSQVNVKVFFAFFILTLVSFHSASADFKLNKQVVNGVELAWAEAGDPNGPPLLMITGLITSHKIWPQDYIDGLVEDGFRVIVYDNRDVGESQRMDHLGNPVVWWNMLKSKVGLGVTAPYTLYDMADDAIGLLDALEIEDAHVMGASMGGMIAQIVAAKHPDRIRSLISIMSSPGADHLPKASDESSSDIEELLDPTPQRTKELNAVGFYPSALRRHFMAILATGDRSNLVKTIEVKTLVIHGEDDTLVPIAHGEYTAQIIKGATFVPIEDMGHNLKGATITRVLDAIEAHMLSFEQAGLSLAP
jgi:pimeloyl-ACP methyl ester carboxylesterase